MIATVDHYWEIFVSSVTRFLTEQKEATPLHGPYKTSTGFIQRIQCLGTYIVYAIQIYKILFSVDDIINDLGRVLNLEMSNRKKKRVLCFFVNLNIKKYIRNPGMLKIRSKLELYTS